MSTSLRVAAVQIGAGTEVAANLELVVEGISAAAEAGADLAVFPEASMVSFGTRVGNHAEPLDGPFASAVRAAAAEAGIVAVVGMFEPSDDGRSFNTLLVTGPGVEGAYRKIRLFDAFGSKESETIAPGSEVVVVEIAGAKVGLATCYDVRFGAHFTALGLAGAEVVLLPASWGAGPGKAEQWDLLVRARAMDAQAWLVACDQAYQPPQGAAPLGIGRSAVVGPLGGVRARLDHTPGLLVADLDLAAVAEVRTRVPVLDGQR